MKTNGGKDVPFFIVAYWSKKKVAHKNTNISIYAQQGLVFTRKKKPITHRYKMSLNPSMEKTQKHIGEGFFGGRADSPGS